VNDPVIFQFAQACGATRPLDLRVDLADGGVLAEGSVHMPFTLIGRDDACDVTLTDAEVNPRHAWLQVVGGRVFAVDLGSRTGLGWADGTTGSGWLDVGVPVRVGPFLVRLRSPVADAPTTFPPRYSPLQSDRQATRTRPPAVLEFRNGRRARDRWTVNRLVTLVGRAPECKIHLTGEDIVGYHCGLVLTAEGLWVVDLSGRGVVVNGERMRVSPLRDGAELWVGRFLIGVNSPAAAQPATPSPPAEPAIPPPAPACAAEDEVDLGTIPPPEPGSGLPSSHIMADAFRLWAAEGGGPMSSPILVSGSGPLPVTAPVPQPGPGRSTLDDRIGTLTDPPDSPTEAVVPLLCQLADIHGQMFAQFQESLVLLVQLFGCLRRDQLPAMQRELARIQELNAELAQLQAEVANRAAAELAAGPPTPPRNPVPPPRPTADPMPVHTPAPSPTALSQWVNDRINTLQHERHTRWQSLVGLFTGKSA
jgi:pSer/pThr/pTyr-binding forkhead associated (FHA) protein